MRVRVAPWAAVGQEVPRPDPTSVTISQDEGADLPVELEERRLQLVYEKVTAALRRMVQETKLQTESARHQLLQNPPKSLIL